MENQVTYQGGTSAARLPKITRLAIIFSIKIANFPVFVALSVSLS
jgi:hypothetical protein